MAIKLTRYESLPLTTRALIEESIGPVLRVEPVEGGLNSALAARVRTGRGEYFLKGLPADHRWVWTQQREADLAPHVDAIAPAVVTHTVTRGWDVLVFTAVKARHADYRPGSPDVAATVSLLQQLATIAPPPFEIRRAKQRLASYVDTPEDAELFAGDALLHTDWNPTNVLIGDRTWLVDWGWATRGAPWLDAGYWIIWLIAAGHHPAATESLAARIPAWSTAPPAAVTAFARANARLWAQTAGTRPDAWNSRLRKASETWARYRHTRSWHRPRSLRPSSAMGRVRHQVSDTNGPVGRDDDEVSQFEDLIRALDHAGLWAHRGWWGRRRIIRAVRTYNDVVWRGGAWRADGEDLAEGDVEDWLRKMTGPLQDRGVELDVHTIRRPHSGAAGYTIKVNGSVVDLYDFVDEEPGMPATEDPWMGCTVLPAAALNRLLRVAGDNGRIAVFWPGGNDGYSVLGDGVVFERVIADAGQPGPWECVIP